MYKIGLIGNCQTSALVRDNGSVDWLCFPRPDSPPVFGRLLDKDGGHFSISPTAGYRSTQEYIRNTNVLVTHFICDDGSEFKVTDFCPRFEQHGRMFRPNSLFRVLEPTKGHPQVSVSFVPTSGWDKKRLEAIRGNSHLKYEIRENCLRLATNMPLTYLLDDTSFALTERTYFGLTWGSAIEEDLVAVTENFLRQTISYWHTWVKHCSVPTLFQKETIRSALALKLHCYEDTGAILAALTTSLPEELHSNRNWDYRFCWLRDAAFVLTAFHNLGHFEEMEGFIKFLLNIGHKYENSREGLRPVYALDLGVPLPENIHENWNGFENSRPVRSNNQAAEHIQNDVYGEMVLALTPIFFDERFFHLRTKEHEGLLETLATLCVKNISQPDAGLWEIRGSKQEHSFSNLMCWAGIERIMRIRQMGFLQDLNESTLKEALRKAEIAICSAVKNKSVRNGPGDDSFDAAMLLMPILRFPFEDLCRDTVLEIESALSIGGNFEKYGFLYRYLRTDDFGQPKSAFIICSFWLVQALARVDSASSAIELLNKITAAANPLGLFSEHYRPDQALQLGNFPQAYSHVGMINAAFSVSPSWSNVL